jgi:hypothetical protein
VPKTPYELWTGREPSLNYLHVWGCPAEAKVFNPNIGKLDFKTVSCHFIGYPKKSKGYHFYCPDRHTKFVETRHAVFLEEELIRRSMIAREINLEEKRVHVPTPMVQEPFFMLSIVAAPTVQDIVVTTPVVSSLVTTMIELEEPVLQDPVEPDVTHEEEHQQLHMEQVPEAPRRSQRVKRSAIPDDYEVYDTKEFQMEGDPTLFEEAMRSAHSLKWLEAIQDEIRSMSTNKVWDLEKISKGAKTVGCKWVYKTKYDSKGNIERFKA